MFRTSSKMDTSRAEFDKEEDIDSFKPEGFDSEKITRQHLMLVMTYKRAPRAFRLL